MELVTQMSISFIKSSQGADLLSIIIHEGLLNEVDLWVVFSVDVLPFFGIKDQMLVLSFELLDLVNGEIPTAGEFL